MKLHQLRYFITVAREQNFTRAAEQLHIAQPPLSRQIQQLEQEIGVQLIERGARPLRLTEAGKLFYDQAVMALEHIDEMVEVTRRFAATQRTRLGVGFVSSTLYGHLPEVIRRFRQDRPEVELVLQEMTSLEQITALKEGRIDVGFGRIPREDPQIDRVLMRNEPLRVALPASNPIAGPGPFKLADLVHLPIIIYPKAPRPSYADQVLALLRARDLRPPMIHEVKEMQAALGLVAAEIGFAIVPASVEGLKRDNVVYATLDEPDASSPVIMSTRKGDLSPELVLMLRLVKRMYRDHVIDFGR